MENLLDGDCFEPSPYGDPTAFIKNDLPIGDRSVSLRSAFYFNALRIKLSKLLALSFFALPLALDAFCSVRLNRALSLMIKLSGNCIQQSGLETQR